MWQNKATLGGVESERRPSGRKRSEQAHSAILKAALALLRQRPYADLNCDMIASEAGVGKQTIYRWWNNKAEVVLEALSQHARAVTAPETGALESDVRAFFEETFRLVRGSRGTGAVLKGLMAEAQLDPEFARSFAAFIETRRSALHAVLARHSRADEHELGTLVDMLFGAFWYRLLLGHAPLTSAVAATLGKLAARGAGSGTTKAL
jgi:AcrR family transcriptional regulator